MAFIINHIQSSQDHVFITGQAGTGKSTLLHILRQSLSKPVAVLAPTGIAALNVDGETIHSFFWFDNHITRDTAKEKGIRYSKNQIFKTVDIIDEISMVRADLLDCIDIFLKTALNFKNHLVANK